MTAATLEFLEQDAFEEDTISRMLPLRFTETTGIGFGGLNAGKSVVCGHDGATPGTH